MAGQLTMRLDNIRSQWEHEFQNLCCREDYEWVLERLEDNIGGGDFRFFLQQICDMFDRAGIRYPVRNNPMNNIQKDRMLVAQYRKIVRGSDSIEDADTMQRRVLRAIYGQMENYPSPQDYMKRIVDSLCDETDGWQEDSLRLRILKQFIKYGDYLKAAGYLSRGVCEYVGAILDKPYRKVTVEEVLCHLDEGVFALLEDAPREEVRARGRLGLIKAADDLAAGNFRAQGGTKRLLYLFAMVYRMTYDPHGSDDIRDVEKSLFRDYYTNNLMRYISAAFRSHIGEFEQNPSGQSINYKNYAEAVYLYYIDCPDLTPLERIKRSAAMIDRLTAAHRREGSKSRGSGTQYYKEGIDELLAMDEAACEAYIGENYDCDTYDEEIHNIVGALQVQTDQNSAYTQYMRILEDFIRLIDNARDPGGVPADAVDRGYCQMSPEEQQAARARYFRVRNNTGEEVDYDSYDCAEGLRLPGIEACANTDTLYAYLHDEAGQDENERTRTEEFRQLLMGINSYMMDTAGGVNKALNVSSPREVTRAAIVTAYYYYYNASYQLSDSSDDEHLTLAEVARQFEAGLNTRLKAAYYQPVSSKNIMDMAMIVSAYNYRSGI